MAGSGSKNFTFLTLFVVIWTILTLFWILNDSDLVFPYVDYSTALTIKKVCSVIYCTPYGKVQDLLSLVNGLANLNSVANASRLLL